LDRALWLLLRLRIGGGLRTFGRSLQTVKGILLTLVGAALFVPMILPAFLVPRMARVNTVYLEQVRRFGPLGLFAYFVLGLVMSSTTDSALAFTPAEVNFLFPAPFRRRHLIVYKLIKVVGASLLLGPWLALIMRMHAASTVAAMIGLMLALVFLQLIAIAVALGSSMVEALAYNRRRRYVLIGLLALLLASALPIGRDWLLLDPLEWPDRLERSMAMQVVLAPFRPFVLAFTAERLWPDLLAWGTLGLALDLAMIGLILKLDAEYLETSAHASARLYARRERARRGQFTLKYRAGGRHRTLPMLPSWGGIGPIAWRQLLAARRDFFRLVLGLFLVAAMTLPGLIAGRRDPDQLAHILGPGLAFLSFYLSMFVGFDFRGDFERMDVLKTLPIAATRLAIGQVAVPILFVTALQWFALAIVAGATGVFDGIIAALFAFALPLNAIVIGIENLWWLWFPIRPIGGGPAGIQMMGRFMLLMMAKLLCIGLAAGLSALVGLAVAWLMGWNWTAGLVAAWIVAVAVAVTLLPPIAWAFRRFDVAADTPA
jgi:hypothetical protein